jgi:hypothetical protein
MVVLRAAKDHAITSEGRLEDKLEIHVFDNQAAEWLEAFRSRYPALDQFCTLTAHSCPAAKVGASRFEGDFDAAFVCIPDEGHATAQAVMLRRDVLTGGQPIMVRVLHSQSGYGELIRDPASGWGENIHAVGLEDPLFDPETATRPEIEMRAQTIHHDYRRVKRQEYLAAQSDQERDAILKQSANCPWSDLSPGDREQNRQLAEKYDEYLSMTPPGKPTRYRRVFMPDQFGPAAVAISGTEFDALAEVEHSRWLAEKRKQGFTFGDDRNRKQNPFLKEWAELTDPQKSFAREFVRGIPRILALADYTILPDEQVPPPQAGGSAESASRPLDSSRKMS